MAIALRKIHTYTHFKLLIFLSCILNFLIFVNKSFSYIPFEGSVKQIAMVVHQDCVITTDNTLYCWGKNSKGTIGNNKTDAAYEPINVLSNIKKVEISKTKTESFNVCALKTGGSLYCWGVGTDGRIGDGENQDRKYPVVVTNNVSDISLGQASVCAIKKDSSLYCWGLNGGGQLGTGDKVAYNTPQKILDDVSSVYTSIDNHTCAIKKNGDLNCWGENHYGQVGNGVHYNDVLDPTTRILTNVTHVSFTGDGNSTCAIRKDRNLYCFGKNDKGQLGVGDTQNYDTPQKVLDNVKSVSSGNATVCAIKNDNSLWCWGENDFGQIGDGTKNNSSIPKRVLENVKSVEVGFKHTCAIKSNNDLYCWGYNERNQTGVGVSGDVLQPTKVLTGVAQISITKYHDESELSKEMTHTCVIKTDGKMVCFGFNDYGQSGKGWSYFSPLKIRDNVREAHLSGSGHNTSFIFIDKNDDLYLWGVNTNGEIGDGSTNTRWGPTRILKDIDNNDIFTNNVRLVRTVGPNSKPNIDHVCAIDTDNDLYCWGKNNYGQVGDGTKSNVNAPTKILSNAKDVSLSYSHTCAVTNDGLLYCWGRNNKGQVGCNENENNTNSGDVTSPRLIATNVSSVQIAGSGPDWARSCALKNDNSLYCWGDNSSGDVGAPSAGNNVFKPQKILDNILDFTVGAYGACAIDNNNNSQLWCWGKNDQGQVGKGDTAKQTSPRIVEYNVKSVKLFYNRTCAIKNDNSLFCWGYNEKGKSGVGSNDTAILSPTDTNLDNVKSISMGYSHTCAITYNNELYCFGDNTYGCVGVKTPQEVISPVKIQENIKQVATGDNVTCIIDNNDTYKCFGDNAIGCINVLNLQNELFDGSGGAPQFCTDCCNHYLYNYASSATSCDNGNSNSCLANGVYTCYNGENHPNIICDAITPDCCENAEFSFIGNTCIIQENGVPMQNGVNICGGPFPTSDVVCERVEGEFCNNIDDNGNGIIDETYTFQNHLGLGTSGKNYDGSYVNVGQYCYKKTGEYDNGGTIIDIVGKGIVRCANLNNTYCHIFDDDDDGHIDDDVCPGLNDDATFTYNGTHQIYVGNTYKNSDDMDEDGFVNCIDGCVDDLPDDSPDYDLGSFNDKKKSKNDGEISIKGDGCEKTPIGGLDGTLTPTITITNTLTNTSTSTPISTTIATLTNTVTDTPTDTYTNTNTYTSTYTETNTNTNIPTDTNTITNTFTDTPTNTYTNTSTLQSVTYTNTIIPSSTNTYTPTLKTVIDVITPQTILPSPQVVKDKEKKSLLVNLPKIIGGAINGNTKNVKVRYLIHVRKLKRLGNKDNFYKLGIKFLTYQRKNFIKLKYMDKGIYSVRYQVIISNKNKSKTTKWSKRTLVEI